MITSSQSVCLYVHIKMSDPQWEQLNQCMNFHTPGVKHHTIGD